MNKAEKIAADLANLAQLDPLPDLPLDARYLGYFAYFNNGSYYEAHDVLEQLWLETPGANHAFYKGLIQMAGAFVHLRKQYLRPDHRVDGQRLRPAARLFRLAEKNLQIYRPRHLHSDVDSLCRLCVRLAQEIENSRFTENPWKPSDTPQLNLY